MLKERELESAAQAQRDFLVSISRELRTPLSSVVGNSELLEHTALDGEQQELLKGIHAAGRSLLYLLNDILDFSQIQEGHIDVDQQVFELNRLLEETEQAFSEQAHSKGLELVVEREREVPSLLEGDNKQIGHILTNLLSNAIKFSQQGKITLAVSVVEERDGHKLRFRVEDQGIGIAREEQESLFKPFALFDDDDLSRSGGAGVGLYISLCLAEKMKGEIRVDSEEGRGSRFDLVLPLSEAVKQQVEARSKLLDEPDEKPASDKFGGRVLLAEDTPELQLLIKRILQQFGLEVSVAGNGREALEQWQQGAFDLVLMDIQMPEMDGLQATRKLRELGCKAPIVALSANVMQKHREQFAESGGDDFLAKPINRTELKTMLNVYLKAAE